MLDIETRDLGKNFGSLVAVRSLNLQIPKGTVFGFLGPNGSGKSTTIKMLTGLLTPTAGEVFIGGMSIFDSALEIKQKIGVLPEDLALFDSLTLWEHLKMCGNIYGLSLHDTKERAEQLLKYLDLWQGRDTYVEQASFGMRKKCAFAMALIHNPGVLFLDEPFEGIDPISARNIKDLFLLMRQKGITIFLTSHILEVAERLIDSFAIIVGGEIVCRQTIEETIQSGRSLEDVYFQYVERPDVENLEWIG